MEGRATSFYSLIFFHTQSQMPLDYGIDTLMGLQIEKEANYSWEAYDIAMLPGQMVNLRVLYLENSTLYWLLERNMTKKQKEISGGIVKIVFDQPFQTYGRILKYGDVALYDCKTDEDVTDLYQIISRPIIYKM